MKQSPKAVRPAEAPNQRAFPHLKVSYEWMNRYCWTLLLFLIALQYLLFRQYIVREVSWAHAPSFDQTVYLLQSYGGFEEMVSGGFWKGLLSTFKPHVANGVMLPAQSAVLMLVTGASRLGALTLGFLYLALAQLVLVQTARWLTGGWSVAFIGLSLFLLSNSRFYWAGGLDDFRIDLIASSLYGITICLIVRSGLYESVVFSAVSGFSATLLILFRFLTTTYIFLLVGLTMIALLALYRRWKTNAFVRTRLRNGVIAILTTSILCAPLLLYNARRIYAYYVGAVVGPEVRIRSAQAGNDSLYADPLYYPRSLVLDHLGGAFLLGACIAILLFAGFRASATIKNTTIERTNGRSSLGARAEFFFLGFIGLSILLPLLCLSVYAQRSPLVAGIATIPSTLLVVAIADALYGFGRSRQVLRFAAGILLFTATATLFAQSARHSTETRFRADEDRLMKMYDEMGAYAKTLGWKAPKMAVDRISDYLNAPQFQLVTYERQGDWMPAVGSLGLNMFEVDKNAAIRAIEESDFTVVTSSDPSDGTRSAFPFDRQMFALKADLRSAATRKLMFLQKVSYRGHEFTVYARPAVSVEGASGPWLTSAGARVSVPCRILQTRPIVTLAGNTMLIGQLHGALGVAAQLGEGEDNRTVRATASLMKDAYAIRLDLRGNQFEREGFCTVSLLFDRYFVPKDIGLNLDTRQLVVLAPTDFSFDK